MENGTIKQTFDKFALNAKIESLDKDGYYVMRACGYIRKHLGDGYAIIEDFDGVHWSTVGIHNIAEIILLD